ncbi:MAG TPA: hypothetical protein VLH39_02410 [Magnetospirillaceae bacterium]|nr:hypothetical protein [Magnetospirillaceae bacterium]
MGHLTAQKSHPLSQERRQYLSERYGLAPVDLTLLLEDIWAFTDETQERYVLRRHTELQKRGWTNDSIFKRIVQELAAGRFSAEPRSLRQIRRIIYG